MTGSARIIAQTVTRVRRLMDASRTIAGTDRHRERRRSARRASTDLEVGRPEVEGEQEAALVHRDLLRAFAELPEEQRSVLFLVAVEDLSYGEAARVLGVPIGTVMSRLSRGREKLRRHMNGDRQPLKA